MDEKKMILGICSKSLGERPWVGVEMKQDWAAA